MKWDEEWHGTILENYRAVVTSCIYDCITCAPYQAHVLSLLWAHMHDSSMEGAMRLYQFLSYMARRLDDPYVIQRTTYDPPTDTNICGFTDFSSADKADRQAEPTKEVILFMNTTPVMWQSKKIRRQSPNLNAAEMAAAS